MCIIDIFYRVGAKHPKWTVVYCRIQRFVKSRHYNDKSSVRNINHRDKRIGVDDYKHAKWNNSRHNSVGSVGCYAHSHIKEQKRCISF